MVVTDSDTGEEFAIYWQDSRNQSRLFFFVFFNNNNNKMPRLQAIVHIKDLLYCHISENMTLLFV